MPVALISTRTSPAFGPSRSSSTISSVFFAPNATAARVFMLNSTFALQRISMHRKKYIVTRRPSSAYSKPSSFAHASLFAHAGVLGLLGGGRLVFVLCGPPPCRGIGGGRPPGGK